MNPLFLETIVPGLGATTCSQSFSSLPDSPTHQVGRRVSGFPRVGLLRSGLLLCIVILNTGPQGLVAHRDERIPT